MIYKSHSVLPVKIVYRLLSFVVQISRSTVLKPASPKRETERTYNAWIRKFLILAGPPLNRCDYLPVPKFDGHFLGKIDQRKECLFVIEHVV